MSKHKPVLEGEQLAIGCIFAILELVVFAAIIWYFWDAPTHIIIIRGR